MGGWLFEKLSNPFLREIEKPRCIAGWRITRASIEAGRVELEMEQA